MRVQLNSMSVVSRFVTFTKLVAPVLLAVAAISSMAAPCQAVLVPTVIYSEDFNATPSPGKFLFSGGGSAAVTGGRLEITKPVGTFPLYYSTANFLDTTFTVETLIGAYNPPGHMSGNESLGLVIGNRSFASFFGYNWGAGTSIFHETDIANVHSSISGYQSTPWIATANGVAMHKLKVDVNAVTKTFNVTFTDANNPSNVYTHTFVDSTWMPGPVGIFSWYDGQGTTSYGYLDNLQVIALREFVPPAPEPSSVVLLGLGSLLLMARRGKR